MKGRKPVPTAVKILRGNPGKRPINQDEPKPINGIPDAPEHLEGEALAEWHRISAELNIAGLITKVDRAPLAMYCTVWARYVEAERQLKIEGAVLKGSEGGSYQNPWLGIGNRAFDQMSSLLAEFGLSPSARTRLSVKQPKAKSDDERFFGAA